MKVYFNDVEELYNYDFADLEKDTIIDFREAFIHELNKKRKDLELVLKSKLVKTTDLNAMKSVIDYIDMIVIFFDDLYEKKEKGE